MGASRGIPARSGPDIFILNRVNWRPQGDSNPLTALMASGVPYQLLLFSMGYIIRRSD